MESVIYTDRMKFKVTALYVNRGKTCFQINRSVEFYLMAKCAIAAVITSSPA